MFKRFLRKRYIKQINGQINNLNQLIDKVKLLRFDGSHAAREAQIRMNIRDLIHNMVASTIFDPILNDKDVVERLDVRDALVNQLWSLVK